MWWRCAYWYRTDEDTPFAKRFACSILGFCFTCKVRWYARHLSHIGVVICIFSGFLWRSSKLLSIALCVLGLLIAVLPYVMDGIAEHYRKDYD